MLGYHAQAASSASAVYYTSLPRVRVSLTVRSNGTVRCTAHARLRLLPAARVGGRRRSAQRRGTRRRAVLAPRRCGERTTTGSSRQQPADAMHPRGDILPTAHFSTTEEALANTTTPTARIAGAARQRHRWGRLPASALAAALAAGGFAPGSATGGGDCGPDSLRQLLLPQGRARSLGEVRAAAAAAVAARPAHYGALVQEALAAGLRRGSDGSAFFNHHPTLQLRRQEEGSRALRKTKAPGASGRSEACAVWARATACAGTWVGDAFWLVRGRNLATRTFREDLRSR